MTNEAILREALDQYVSNLSEHVESQDDPSPEDRAKLEAAERMLDDLNARFLARLGVA